MLIEDAHKEYLNKLLDELKNFDDDELRNFFDTLTKEKALSYGFRNWSGDRPNFLLIPACFFDFIPIGLKVQSLTGKEIIYDGNNIDDDSRFGLLAYGINIKENKDE